MKNFKQTKNIKRHLHIFIFVWAKKHNGKNRGDNATVKAEPMFYRVENKNHSSNTIWESTWLLSWKRWCKSSWWGICAQLTMCLTDLMGCHLERQALAFEGYRCLSRMQRGLVQAVSQLHLPCTSPSLPAGTVKCHKVIEPETVGWSASLWDERWRLLTLFLLRFTDQLTSLLHSSGLWQAALFCVLGSESCNVFRSTGG